jgi:hypothetical protein
MTVAPCPPGDPVQLPRSRAIGKGRRTLTLRLLVGYLWDDRPPNKPARTGQGCRCYSEVSALKVNRWP